MDNEEMKSINESLKGNGLKLSDSNVWIGIQVQQPTIQPIQYMTNHQEAHVKDNILGISGPPAEAKTIVDIPCEVVWDGKKEKKLLEM
jgi:hypothetical protein